jgi:hypothetical protein
LLKANLLGHRVVVYLRMSSHRMNLPASSSHVSLMTSPGHFDPLNRVGLRGVVEWIHNNI